MSATLKACTASCAADTVEGTCFVDRGSAFARQRLWDGRLHNCLYGKLHMLAALLFLTFSPAIELGSSLPPVYFRVEIFYIFSI